MSTPLNHKLAKSIQFKLAELGPWCLQKHYLKEATYLVRSWRGLEETRHELAAWSMAKDFSRRFPRHSYHEWAFVFGIPKNHTLLAFPLHPHQLRRRRVIYAVRNRVVQFVVAYVLTFGSLVVWLYW